MRNRFEDFGAELVDTVTSRVLTIILEANEACKSSNKTCGQSNKTCESRERDKATTKASKPKVFSKGDLPQDGQAYYSYDKPSGRVFKTSWCGCTADLACAYENLCFKTYEDAKMGANEYLDNVIDFINACIME